MRRQYGVQKQWPVIIESPFNKRQKAAAQRLRKKEEEREKEAEQVRHSLAENLTSFTPKYFKGPWGAYARYWYKDGSTK